jgi:hypothetical protein
MAPVRALGAPPAKIESRHLTILPSIIPPNPDGHISWQLLCQIVPLKPESLLGAEQIGAEVP